MINAYEIEEEFGPEREPAHAESARVIDVECQVLSVEPSAKPLLIIQERDRSPWIRLALPLAILVGAGVVVWLRYQYADWRGIDMWPRVRRSATNPNARPSASVPKLDQNAALPAPEPVAEPIIARIEGQIAPAAESIAPETAVAAVPETAAPAAQPPPVDPGVARAETPPPDPRNEPQPPSIRTEDVKDEIRREAMRKQAEIDALRELKERQRLQSDALLAEARNREIASARETTNRARLTFHSKLKEIIAASGANSASKLVALAQEQGAFRSSLNDIGPDATDFGVILATQRRRRIEQARADRYPEAAILEALARSEIRNLNARNGPRSAEDAIYRAALKLIDVPPSADPLAVPATRPARAPANRR